MTPDEIREKGRFPARLPALAAPQSPRGRHGVPEVQIDEIKKQTAAT